MQYANSGSTARDDEGANWTRFTTLLYGSASHEDLLDLAPVWELRQNWKLQGPPM